MRRLARLWHAHPLLVLAFLAACLLFAGFLIRLFLLAPHWHPDGPPPPLAGWMTPRFIIHAYHLPPEDLGAVLGLDRGEKPRATLDQIAAEQGVPLADLLARIAAAIAAQPPQ